MGVAIDSGGNIWVANDGIFDSDPRVGDVSLGRPDDADQPDCSANDGTMIGPWGIAVDGRRQRVGRGLLRRARSQHVRRAAQLPERSGHSRCGHLAAGRVRRRRRMQHITSIVIDQAGNVLVANNNNDQETCDFPPNAADPTTVPSEKASMSCGGNGVLVLFGLARRLRRR